MQLGDKEEFVKEFVRGYLDGHDIEEMEPEQMHDNITRVEGFAEGVYQSLLNLKEMVVEEGCEV
jgi:hypothetical protein